MLVRVLCVAIALLVGADDTPIRSGPRSGQKVGHQAGQLKVKSFCFHCAVT